MTPFAGGAKGERTIPGAGLQEKLTSAPPSAKMTSSILSWRSYV
ncbi:MAG: hypothetical protein Q8P12_06650 [bacterium]|nr:hypothetical protein [bacterium]